MKNHNQSQSPVHPSPLHTGTGWGGVFFFHHLKTAWRNLLKYKTQNIISIACLAVGVVCFAVVFQMGSAYLRNPLDLQSKRKVSKKCYLCKKLTKGER